MVLSRLLQKFKINNIVLEKHHQLSHHPKAHYLSFRTCEILEDLLEEDNNFIYDQMGRTQEWNKFLYT